MSKKVAVWLVFSWKDLMEQLKEEDYSKGDIVFILDSPSMSSAAVALTSNVQSACRKKGIQLIEDYDELQEAIYQKKVEYRATMVS